MAPKLLILASQEEDTHRILAGLLQEGLEARGRHCAEPDKLQEMIAASAPDILLYSPQSPLIDLSSRLEQFRKLDTDLPLILLTDASIDAEQLLEARKQGARDATAKDNLALLALVIAREYGDLNQRRLVKKLQRRVQALEDGHSKANPKPQVHRSAQAGSPQVQTEEGDRQFAQRIKRALGGDYFQLFYQPIVSLKGDGQERYNVFIRLRNDLNEIREANEFLAAAVQSGRMVAVDHWVIERAILALAEQRDLGRQLNFFINLAEETLREANLATWISERLAHRQVPADWLTFQVMEEHALAHSDIYGKLTQDLAQMGCHMALNRFGKTHAPLKPLVPLPADFVKLDPQLTHGITDDDRKEKRLHQFLEVIRNQSKGSIATNVEDARTLSVLWTAGIDYVQGNFLQRPSPTLDPVQ